MDWDDVDDFLIRQAEADLAACGQVRPCLVAFAGDEPLLVAFVRPFPKGHYEAPLTELLALTAALAADRLALSVAGRAWSLDDPVPPVLEGVGDLRQRVVCTLTATDSGCRQLLHPFTATRDEIAWGQPLCQNSASGWIARALQVAVSRRDQLAASADEAGRQALRCARLGHELALDPGVVRRLSVGGVIGPAQTDEQDWHRGASNN